VCPTRQGNREQNGVRNLIFAVLWEQLQVFGLPAENKIRTGKGASTLSISAVIKSTLQNEIGLVMTEFAIKAAVYRITIADIPQVARGLAAGSPEFAI